MVKELCETYFRIEAPLHAHCLSLHGDVDRLGPHRNSSNNIRRRLLQVDLRKQLSSRRINWFTKFSSQPNSWGPASTAISLRLVCKPCKDQARNPLQQASEPPNAPKPQKRSPEASGSFARLVRPRHRSRDFLPTPVPSQTALGRRVPLHPTILKLSTGFSEPTPTLQKPTALECKFPGLLLLKHGQKASSNNFDHYFRCPQMNPALCSKTSA